MRLKVRVNPSKPLLEVLYYPLFVFFQKARSLNMSFRSCRGFISEVSLHLHEPSLAATGSDALSFVSFPGPPVLVFERVVILVIPFFLYSYILLLAPRRGNT